MENQELITQSEQLAQEAVPADGQVSNDNGSNSTYMDSVINNICAEAANLVKDSDRKALRDNLKGILNTIMVMNCADEYAIGIRVKGDLYRFTDYQGLSTINDLVIAAKVVVEAVPTAIDLLKREAYKVSGDALTPSEFALATRVVCRLMRINPVLSSISRPSEAVLADVTKYVVNSRKVRSASNSKLYFLKSSFDNEAVIPVPQWTKNFVSRLFS